MNLDSPVSFDHVIDELVTVCEEISTGVYFLISANNVMGQFVVQNGNIISIKYEKKRDQDALHLFLKMKNETFTYHHFSSTDVSNWEHNPETLPLSTQEIIGSLKTESSSGFDQNIEHYDHHLDPHKVQEICDIIVTELAYHLGPMARIIFDQQFHALKDVPDVIEMVEKLSNEIDDVEKRSTFQLTASQKIYDIV